MFRIFKKSIFNQKNSFNSRKFFSSKNSFNSKSSFNSNNKEVDFSFLTTSLLLTSGAIYLFREKSTKFIKINWIELKKLINENSIKKIEIRNDKKAVIYNNNNENIYLMDVSNGDSIEKKIENINDNIEVEHIHPSEFQILLTNLLPSLFFLGIFMVMMRRQQGSLAGLFKNESKIIEEKTGVKISDVAGLHKTKSNVLEFSDIIMNPEKYQKIGTKIPKGILMEGPPGTGKTMLAKAIADHYDSSFYLLNGSDFIQPIVGTGSRKVKDLFDTARGNTPAIIFIDEIDAVGKSRNHSKNIGNDERDNILNSLLVEMDGFEDNSKLLVIGATNRADILDSALLRPGRFDRIVKFDLPDVNERKEIMNNYFTKYKFDGSINKDNLINKLSMLTYGFNGAQISNLFNESSIFAIRNNSDSIKEEHIDSAIDYILLGNKKENFISAEEKEIIACHEAGHALISYLLENMPSPTKVSIVPREKGMLGFSQAIPKYEKKLYNREDLISQMMVLMGGRAAEEIIFKKCTNGASDDINKINKIAREIITSYGMNNIIGLRTLDSNTQNNFWTRDSNAMLELVDEEINNLINETYELSVKLLNSNLPYLNQIRSLLIKKESITDIDLDLIFNKKI